MSSLLREILERIEFERLIEEGRDPVEVLHYKFSYIPSDIIDSVIEIDPTKKKSYSQWLLSKWNDEKDVIMDNLENGRIEKLFNHYKNHNDIQIKDCPSVEDGLMAFVPEEETVLGKSSKPMTYVDNLGMEVDSSLANDFDIVYKDDDWVIAVPNTYEAECKLGENTRWCTANHYGNGRSFYDNYVSKGGKFYVNFDLNRQETLNGKDYPFKRYQFHFETNQFMDAEDGPVTLEELGLPDGVNDFYSDEGYDTDDYLDMEVKQERYEEQRYACEIKLNDDLVLNIRYDDDFELEEIDEDTDFYVYDINDDRDPISWYEIKNPNTAGWDNVVLLNTDDVIVLRCKNGENMLGLVHNSTGGGWREWEAVLLKDYITLPNNSGVFGLTDKSVFTVLSSDLFETYEKLKVNSCDDMFVNEQCTKAYDAENEENIFVEAVHNGFHSLFNISISALMGDDLICVVYRDVPVNGGYFTINEQGLIEGEFRNYRVYDDSEYSNDQEDSNMLKYDLEAELETGDYLVSVTDSSSHGKKCVVYNILKKETKQPLIDNWFDKFIAFSRNLYGVKKENKIGFFNINSGQQVGRWYDDFRGLDQERDVIYGRVGTARFGSKEEFDLLSGYENKVIGTFESIISAKPINNKLIVQTTDGSTRRVFDYVEHKFYFPELDGFMRISEYENPYIFACNIANTEENAIFDLKTQKVVIRGIRYFRRMNRVNLSYIKLIKMNGKCNIFNLGSSSEMLQNDVDDITSMNVNIDILVYKENGKYYPLNYRTNNFLINPNGISIPTYVDDSYKIYCSGENYDIYFCRVNSHDEYKFYKWENRDIFNDCGKNIDPNNTPQEVINMYNLILGQQESITSEFHRYMSRIDEAFRLGHS